MYQFLNNLVNTESPRTIIQAVVNTIQSETIHEVDDRRRINEFYLAMDKHFGFQYGSILLALSTKSQLKEMLDKGWPFFDEFKKELVKCLKEGTCSRIEEHINSLGTQHSVYYL